MADHAMPATACVLRGEEEAMAYETLLYDVADRVATITLNRPEKMNALSPQVWRDLEDALRTADADAGVRALVLAARGRAFCAGADMSASAGPNARPPRTLLEWYDLEQEGERKHRLFRDLTKPIVAAVQGYALAWGLELACMCDFIIASDQARFGAPEIRHGSTIVTLLPWLIGMQNARYLLYSGDTIDAQEAYRIGLAFRVVPHDQLAAEAHRFARRLALIPPVALRLNKRQLDGMLDLAGMRNAVAYGALAATICHAMQEDAETPDGRNLAEIRRREGLRAFLQARDAPYRD
jgi:enoyl-CoA hydratase/carnithine racemase